jgi:hypothetical protein
MGAVIDEAIIDEAKEIALRQAGDHLQKTGSYPAEDDTDDSGDKAWKAAWADLQRRGAEDGLYDACYESWSSGFLGSPA